MQEHPHSPPGDSGAGGPLGESQVSQMAAHLDSLYNVAFRVLGSEAEAEQAVLNTFKEARGQLGDAVTPEALKVGLFRLLASQLVSKEELDEAWRSAEGTDAWSVVTAAAKRQGVSEEEIDFERLQEMAAREPVLESLANLPIALRAIVVLVDIEGFRYQEVAEILGTDRTEAISLLYAGRRLLRIGLWADESEQPIQDT